jgi:uncharacterized protein YecT (DUF1311 family)
MFLRSALPSFLGLGLVLLPATRARAQDAEPDPCASTVTNGALRQCWARELEIAEGEMKEAFAALRTSVPSARVDALKKAQAFWIQFRDAHVSALYGTDWRDPDVFTCALIARRQLTRARTAELKRMLREAGDAASCPL